MNGGPAAEKIQLDTQVYGRRRRRVLMVVVVVVVVASLVR